MMYFPLEVIYVPTKCTLLFNKENVQEELYKHIKLKEVTSFEGMDEIDCGIFNRVTDLDHYSSYYALQMLSEDEIRFCETITELTNGIKIITDLNLTNISAPTNELLLEYMVPIFETMGYDSCELYKIIIEHPFENLIFPINKDTPSERSLCSCPF